MPHRVDHFATVLAANNAGRAELLRMHRSGEVDDVVLQELEEELDLEEMKVGRFAQNE
jgi:CPA1 family monovalent cation:H+ antiporter